MASTNKTPQLGLNQWAAGDEVLRADFNADNLKIEALVGQSACVVGRFLGDDQSNRIINVGVKPKFVLLFGRYDARYLSMGVIINDTCYCTNSGGLSGMQPGALKITETGFMLDSSMFYNGKGSPTDYIAFY